MRTLTTPRLILRPLALEDAPAIQAGFPKWEVVRYLDAVVPWPYPDDGALTYIRDVALAGMRRGEEWHWSIRPLTAADQVIGVITLRLKQGDNRGFWLDPTWQGQGLMSEACAVVTDFWFGGSRSAGLAGCEGGGEHAVAPDLGAELHADGRVDPA